VCCPSAKAKVLAIVREHPIQIRKNYNPPHHRSPYLVAHAELARSAGRPVTEGFSPPIISLRVNTNMAHDHDSLVGAAAHQAASR
jgi:hypothetical protein